MRIAVTYENGSVFQHFGHTEHFAIYDIHDTQILSKVVVPVRGTGHGALAGFLKNFHVDILICGGIGGGAQDALAQAGIRLFGGVQGNVDEAVITPAANTAAGNIPAAAAVTESSQSVRLVRTLFCV